MSNQRNADKDRELFTLALSNRVEFLTPYGDIVLHWLERAAAAEQRVSELEKANAVLTYKIELYRAEMDGIDERERVRFRMDANGNLTPIESEDRP